MRAHISRDAGAHARKHVRGGDGPTKHERYFRAAREMGADEAREWRRKRPAQYALYAYLHQHPLRRALGEASGGPAPETLLRDVTEAIAFAKADSHIKLIVLNLDDMKSGGLSKLQEIGAALRDFRASGKRVVAAGDSFDQAQYYIAAQAGEVYLDPMGMVAVDGFSYYRMFYKDAIDKLGVDFNVFRAGTFKSYTDQFSRNDMAPSEREETSVWLEALWSAYSQDVTRARSLPG
jgi:protease-4